MSRGVIRRLISVALVLPAVLVAGCESELGTGPRIVGIVAFSGSGQSGIVGGLLSQPLIVRAEDQNGDPVSGVTVTWSVLSGGGTVSPSQSTTGSDGRAQTDFRLGSALGTQSVRASFSGATPVTFSATAAAAPASQLAVEAGDNQTGTVNTALSSQISVKVTDAFGNAKSGVTVAFAVTLGGGTLSSPSAVSNASGIASVSWTLGTGAGPQRVTAASAGVASLSFNATAVAAAAAKTLIVGGANQSAPPGARLTDSLVLKVTDQFDNPVADVTVLWAAVGDAGSVSPTSSRTDAAGRAGTSWTLGATGGPKAVRATVGSLPPVQFQAAGTIVFASTTAGGRHSCALDEGGVVYCWGFNGDGQLGLGQTAAGSGPVFASPQPTAVLGGQTFSLTTGGGYHSCGLTLSSNPFCWGKNVDGRLGDGSNASANTPVHLSGVSTFARMSAGAAHTCALTAGGRVHCWGANDEGQVGIVLGGVITSDSAAFNVPMPVRPASIFQSVAAGGLHSCAVDAAGDAWCWGYNTDGQLGTGGFAASTFPVAVTGGGSFVSVTAGNRHTCALTSAGDAWCWGDNSWGQLGDGTTTDAAAPTAVSGGLVFASLSSGSNHTCGVTTSGVAWCWGRNAKGQLGDGSLADATAPVPVGGGLSFASVSAGDQHSCGVTVGRVAWCWGDNQFGQLGDGSQIMRSLPAKVAFQP